MRMAETLMGMNESQIVALVAKGELDTIMVHAPNRH